MSSIVSLFTLLGSFFGLCLIGTGMFYLYVVLGPKTKEDGDVLLLSGGVFLVCSFICFVVAAIVKGLIQ